MRISFQRLLSDTICKQNVQIVASNASVIEAHRWEYRTLGRLTPTFTVQSLDRHRAITILSFYSPFNSLMKLIKIRCLLHLRCSTEWACIFDDCHRNLSFPSHIYLGFNTDYRSFRVCRTFFKHPMTNFVKRHCMY